MIHYPSCDFCGECKCCPAHNCGRCKMNKPIKVSRNELVGILKAITASIEARDSFEGSITYSCMDGIFGPNTEDVDPLTLERDEFFIGGVYRVGNSLGQGGVNFLWEVPDEIAQEINESELGCPPGCTSPFCNCPGTD